MNENILQAAEIIGNSKLTLALTGAGISTPSGIPDFRSPGTGVWENIDPMQYATIWAFLSNTHKVYEFYAARFFPIFNAQPNAAHYALTQLQNKNLLSAIITQNIDGLHQKSGSKNVIEMHGTIREGICLKCSKIFAMSEVADSFMQFKDDKNYKPTCECSGLIKPNVVLFGEQLPNEELHKCDELINKCECFIVVGSSLLVQPVCFFPEMAVGKGAKLIIVNMQPTPLDNLAEIIINDKLEIVLPEIVKNINI